VLVVGCSDAVTSTGDGGNDAASDGGAPDSGASPDTGSLADSGDPNDGLTAAELATLGKMSPLPTVPADTTNKYADDAKAAALGQMLFFDKSYSGALTVGDDGSNGGLGMAGDTGKVACRSCHGGPDLDDLRSKPNNVSLGTDFGTRNAPGITNSSFYKWTNWGGRFDSQWSLPLAVAENAKIMKSSRLQIAHMLWTKYRTEYNATFAVALDADLDPSAVNASRFPAAGKPKASANDPDGAWEGMTSGDRDIVNVIFANYGKALQAYERLLVSRNAPFDRYVAGDRSALTQGARRGVKLFLGKAKCVQCHSGPNLSDDDFHALGVPQTGLHVPATDLGRNADVPPLLASVFNTAGNFSDDKNTGKLTNLTQTMAQRGQFRTKSLRGVADSAPYMHAGELATLADVVAFYDVGGGDTGDAGVTKDPLMIPLALSTQEKADLVELMQTAFTGDPVPAKLQLDTSK
jgi:cytochrome c peroxidase